jgi:hypothetical protein
VGFKSEIFCSRGGRNDHYGTWDLCDDFKNIFAKKIGGKMAFLTQNKAKLCKI